MLALGLDAGRVMLVDEATGEEKWTVQAHELGSRTMVAMSPNGRFVLSVGGIEENWKLREAADGAEWMAGARHGTGACICEVDELGHRVGRFEPGGCPVVAHTAGIISVAFSPCGKRFATGDDDGVVIIWDAQTGEAEQRIKARFEFSLSFSADGARVASGCLTPEIEVWDVTTGALLRTINLIISDIFIEWTLRRKQVFFSPTDNRILMCVGSTDPSKDSIRVWNVESGERMESLNGRVFAAFSPDGRTIATARTSNARDIILIDVESREIVRRLSPVGHLGSFLSASFVGKEGSKLVAASTDDTYKVWDLSTGALLRSKVVGGGIGSLAWGPDWVRDTQMAFAMGHHPRLGGGSQVLQLEPGVLRIILDSV